MVVKFRKRYLEKLYKGEESNKKSKYSRDVVLKYQKAILILQLAEDTKQLRQFKGLNFEALKGDFKGYYSVRVDLKYRIIFSIEKDQSLVVSEILVIEDLSSHNA